MKKGPCWQAIYRPYNKKQQIFENQYCNDYSRRFICFNAADERSNNAAQTNQEALVQVKDAEMLNHLTSVSAFLALATLTVGLAVAFVRSNKKVKSYEKNMSILNLKTELK